MVRLPYMTDIPERLWNILTAFLELEMPVNFLAYPHASASQLPAIKHLSLEWYICLNLWAI